MHNLTKIKVFKALLYLTYPLALLFVYPLVLFKRKNTTALFFFFDRYVIGGAQRIHLDILESIADTHKQLYFTRFSPNHALKQAFYSIPNTEAKDIHFWCDNLLIRLFTVHYYAFYINRHGKAHVFSSNSTFFYDMIPFLCKHVVITELLHNFTHGRNGMEFFGLANHARINNRIVYDVFTLSNIKKQYAEYNVAASYTDRIKYIEPGVIIPPRQPKAAMPPLQVLYAGRGGAQKRIPLLNSIAEHCLKNNMPVSFHFAGTMMDELSDYVKQHSVIHGEISDAAQMYALYQQSHIILMTSAYEGFPMLIKESMACSCVPVVTALEGNKAHLTHMANALLIQQPENEAHVIAEGIQHLEKLVATPELLAQLSNNAYAYAQQHFNRERFMQQYRDFFAAMA